MKRQYFTYVAAIAVILSSVAAFGQNMNVRANVPFNFVVRGNTLPAGQYDILSMSSTGGVLSVRMENKPMATIGTNSIESLTASEKTKLIFHRYGSEYFLAEVWLEGNSRGVEIPKTHREKELALNQGPGQVVVLAELR
jgi:hypothetical protein